MELTRLQEVVLRFTRIYSDETFIEMVQLLDNPEYWENLFHDELTDDECIGILWRLSSMYSEWNAA
jgi:hypothetical protein